MGISLVQPAVRRSAATGICLFAAISDFAFNEIFKQTGQQVSRKRPALAAVAQT